MTIFDLITAQEIAAYWDVLNKDRPPYLGETLFPTRQKMGLDLKWIKGKGGTPVVLKASAFDVGVVPRARLGFSTMQTQMPFFKESMYIDEELRQQLNIVMESGNQAMIDAITNRVFDDEARLLDASRVRLEAMRMMALTTGVISIASNGQKYDYDFGVPDSHKDNTAAAWRNTSADILAEIQAWQDLVEDDTGTRPTRAVMDSKTWAAIRRNAAISKMIYVFGGGDVQPNDNRIKSLLLDELGLQVEVYTKRYTNDQGQTVPFIGDNTFVLMPAGDLGNTWKGMTPEESDLRTSNAANVAIVDSGTAITTMPKTDPVNVETKVSMISLPSFEAADQIFIADTSGPSV